MTTKTYTTIVGAYTAAEKAGTKIFDADYYGYSHCIDEILAKAYKSANARIFAKGNLRKAVKTLYALECTSAKDSKAKFQWVAIGNFDSDGLLYPANTDTPKQTEDKPKKKAPHKPTPAKGKANKKAIRSECYKLAKGNIAEYDRLCKERGVDNHR